MTNIKLKIKTLLIGIIIATICSSFLVTNISYAITAKQQAAIDKKYEADCKKQGYTSCADKVKETQCKKTYGMSCADYAKTGGDKQELQCQKAYGMSCAEAALKKKADNATDNNNLTEGTFSVKDHLTLDDGEQAKKYFDTPGTSPIVSLVMTFIDFAITIMGAIAVILFIVAGFMFMASNGNQTKLDEAKDIIKYAAIGLIVALLAYVITIFVQSIFSNG